MTPRILRFLNDDTWRFLQDESGATAIEYGLIAAGISVAILVAVQALGSGLNTTFTSVSAALK
ncbi:MAG: Flp family type IVb pilin [Xanthobacteraceae bacterium]